MGSPLCPEKGPGQLCLYGTLTPGVWIEEQA